MQSDVKKAVDAKAYPKVQADIRHQLGTLRYDTAHGHVHHTPADVLFDGCLADSSCKFYHASHSHKF